MDAQIMSKKKILFIVFLFLITLTVLRVLWVLHFQAPVHTEAEKGSIDLHDWTFTNEQTLSLDGEWEFYPDQFIMPSDTAMELEEKKYIMVPEDWKKSLSVANQEYPYGYGTYRLLIKLPDNSQSIFGLRFKGVQTAAAVYIDGKQILQHNTPDIVGNQSATVRGPFSVLFSKEQNEVELVVHVSNYEFPFWGGIHESVKIGLDTAITKETNRSLNLQKVVVILFLVHSIYAFFLYFTGRRNKQRQLLYYGLFLAISAVSVLLDDDIVLQLPIGIEWTTDLLLISFVCTLLAMLLVIKHLFRIDTKFFHFIIPFTTLLLLAVFFVPLEKSLYLIPLLTVFYMTSLIFLFRQTLKIIRMGYSEAIFILLWLASYTSNIIWGAFIKSQELNLPYYPLDYLISIIVIVILLFKQYQRVAKVNEEQTVQLQKADQHKDEFLANTSHELRNPLHGIITIAQTLLGDDEDKLLKENRKGLELLVSVGQQMTLLLNDLLDVRRLQDGVVQLDQKSMSIQGVASGVFDLTRYLTEGKNVELRMDIAEDFPAILADENRVVQILFNLIQNATKFTNEGYIAVYANHDKKMATISVVDTGIGMSEETMRKIFLPYEQERKSVISDGGIGLGLVICKNLVELHGGKMSVTSTIGEGTTFLFTLPLANEEALAPDLQEVAVTLEQPIEMPIFEEQVDSSTRPRILVVDDDPVNVRVIQMLLDPKYTVTTATSATEALLHIEKEEWDLIISDVMMPNMSGYELTQRIRQLYTMSELPILLLTARSQAHDISTGFDSGANDYVSKPVDTVELLARVEGLVELKQSVYEQLRTEAAWLQAQIQPHFLFNTLNTIASLAEIDSGRMMRLLEEFGNYLRKSFDVANTSSLVSLENELDLTRSYVYIEHVRFGERLHVEWEIEEGVDIQIPPLSIQPLVENAIRHGVLKRIEGGTVCIRVATHDSYTEISIIDDGVGISSDKVDELVSGQLSQSERGIGITNTDRRCRQLFGSGLHIVSEEGKGTIISFQIPHEVKTRD